MTAPLLTVSRYVWHPHHRRFYCHGTTVHHDDGAFDTLSRAFGCAACGEALVDGDRGYDTEQGFVHERCHPHSTAV